MTLEEDWSLSDFIEISKSMTRRRVRTISTIIGRCKGTPIDKIVYATS